MCSMGSMSKNSNGFLQMDSEDDSDPEFTVWFKTLKKKAFDKLPVKIEDRVDTLNLIRIKNEFPENEGKFIN